MRFQLMLLQIAVKTEAAIGWGGTDHAELMEGESRSLGSWNMDNKFQKDRRELYKRNILNLMQTLGALKPLQATRKHLICLAPQTDILSFIVFAARQM